MLSQAESSKKKVDEDTVGLIEERLNKLNKLLADYSEVDDNTNLEFTLLD